MTNNNTHPKKFQQGSEYKILDHDLIRISRPLALIEGRAYAASWVRVEKTVPERPGKKIESNHNTSTSVELVIIRDDGKVYGLETSIKELGLDIHLEEKPDSQIIWSGNGIRRYQIGERPSPKNVFDRLIKVLDTFIDFNKSLADQKSMSELIACWILATWFLDAFNVAGYLWITGERGSGKSDLLGLIARLSNLGQFISHSGSFASLRDMADYGATLAFDDAESITYQNDKDPDKRALLLAGNHRGLTVPLKEQGLDKKWHIRYVNAFCPRAFSAIRVPDSVLESRMIMIPLVRTFDKRRSNIDPMDDKEWLCDRRELVDDLWALALANLSQMPQWDTWVGNHAELGGRNLQPWRGLLAVAGWLEQMGIPGLYQRMQAISVKYQDESVKQDISDLTRLVIQALGVCAVSAIRADRAVEKRGHFETTVSDVRKVALSMATDQELDIEYEKIALRLVGRTIGKLRFEQVPRPSGVGSRTWNIDLYHLTRLAESYNVPVPGELVDWAASLFNPFPDNGMTGINGSNGTIPVSAGDHAAESNRTLEPAQECYTCGKKDYRQISGGGWVCNVCHPSQE
ncbi:MAG: hypothetical protein ABSG01_00435 [Anaerolineales bacterium]|jgi:hypothetical protein